MYFFESHVAQPPDPRLAALLQRPLITGASVSAGYGTVSPGKRLSLRYAPESQIQTLAQAGTPGREIEPRLSDALLRGRSLVIAMDLFFWDSTLASAEQSLISLDRLLERGSAHGIPVVLGDISMLLPGRQPSRKTLNEALRESCRKYANCALLPLDALHQKVLREGVLTIDGRSYSLRELVPTAFT